MSDRQLTANDVSRSYDRLAPVYDWVIGKFLTCGREQAIHCVGTKPRSVLEIGIGTGLSLPQWPSSVDVVGIDANANMLRGAKARLRSCTSARVQGLVQMDATRLAFRDASFDLICSFHVMAVVSNPQRVLKEMQRVCRPGGEILILSYFGHDSGPMASMERLVSRALRSIAGTRPDLRLSELLCSIDTNTVEISKVGLRNLFTLVRIKIPLSTAKAASPLAASG